MVPPLITDPKDLDGLPSGTYEVGGEAAEEVHRQYAEQVRERPPYEVVSDSFRYSKPPAYEPTQPPPAPGTAESVVVKAIHKLTVRSEYDSRAFALSKYQQRKEASAQARAIVAALRAEGFLPELTDRLRTECSRCFVHHQWYELQPGTGLCNDCSS